MYFQREVRDKGGYRYYKPLEKRTSISVSSQLFLSQYHHFYLMLFFDTQSTYYLTLKLNLVTKLLKIVIFHRKPKLSFR